MRTRLPAVVVLLVVMLFEPMLVCAQSSNAGKDWSAVKSLAVAAELQVRRKDGGTKKGRFVSANDSELVLSNKNIFSTIAQNEIRRVYVVVSNRRGDLAKKGAAIGSLLAFAGVNGIEDSSGDGLPPVQTMIALGIIGAGMGWLMGFVLASPHTRVLVYESN